MVVRCGGAAVMGWWSGRGGGKGGGSCTPSGRAWLRQAWRVGRLWVAGMPPPPTSSYVFHDMVWDEGAVEGRC